jgi:Transcriptional regulators
MTTISSDHISENINKLLYDFACHLQDRLAAVASRYDLTAPQVEVLGRVANPVPMRQLAEAMHCDASNITGIVDRLEARDLVVRRPSPSDRRVSQIVLTPQGQMIYQHFCDDLYGNDELLTALDGSERETLHNLLQRLTATLAR